MKDFKFSKTSRIIVTLVAVFLVFSFSFVPQKTNAFWGIADVPADAPASWGSWLEETWNTYLSSESWWKEWILDPIAYAVAQELLSSITESTVEWINSGFEGNPLYDVNFGDSISEGLNEASGILIDRLKEESGIDLCDNVAPNLRLSFSYTKPFEYKMKCTLNDAIDNVEEFYQDFTKGGWRGWLTLTTQPQNNPYGAYIETAAEYDRMRAEKKEEMDKEIASGDGFKSFKKCDEYTSELTTFYDPEQGETVPDPTSRVCKHWSIQTPGKTIEARLSKATGVDFAALGFADEMSEIISALLQQAMKAIFTEGSTSEDGNSRGGLRNANVSQDRTPATIQEEMDLLKMKLEIYYDFFTETSTSMPYGAHYSVKNTVYSRYSKEERFWRLAQFCRNGGTLQAQNVSDGLEYLDELTTAINNTSSSCRDLKNYRTAVDAAEDLYIRGFANTDGKGNTPGVYDPLYKDAGWLNVTSKVLSAWKSKLSELEGIQRDDTSDLKMSKMKYNSAEEAYKEECCDIPTLEAVGCYLSAPCQLAKIVEALGAGDMSFLCPCMISEANCIVGGVGTGTNYEKCEGARVNGKTCKRGDTCEGGTMRPTLDSAFCCVGGGTCVSDGSGYDGETCVPEDIPITQPNPVSTCAGSQEACSSTVPCCNTTSDSCGHLSSDEPIIGSTYLNKCYPSSTSGLVVISTSVGTNPAPGVEPPPQNPVSSCGSMPSTWNKTTNPECSVSLVGRSNQDRACSSVGTTCDTCTLHGGGCAICRGRTVPLCRFVNP